MHIERIKYLLKQKKNKVANQSELFELASMIRSGHYDQEIKYALDQDFKSALASRAAFDKQNFNASSILDNIVHSKIELEHTPKIWQKFNLSWLAAAMLLISIGFGWVSYKNQKAQVQLASISATDTKVSSGAEKRVIALPDGSTVILNVGSELTYRKEFNENRTVILSGEAFFDIQKNPERPFTVHTGKVITKVLGTAFNINSNEKNVTVTVERGLVQVGNADQVFAKIKPQQEIQVDTKTQHFQLEKKIKTNRTKNWRNQILVIDELSFEETMVLLETRFDRHITIENPAIKKCRISANFLNDESLEDILTVVCGSRQAAFKTDQKNAITIIGGLSCN